MSPTPWLFEYVISLIHTDPYYHKSEWRSNKALSPIESFGFHQLTSTISYTLSAPFTRLKTIFQLRKIITEFNICTNISLECLSDPSLTNIIKSDGINGLFAGNMCSVIRIFAQNMLHLVIKKGIRRRFFSTRRNDGYLKHIAKTFISGFIGNIIAKNFTYYLLTTAVRNRMGIKQTESYQFGLSQTSFMSTHLSGFMYRSAWFLSVYGIEAYCIPKNYWLKRIIRKFIPLIIPYPFYTIRNRQIITNENLFDAAKTLISNYGFKSLFDGLAIKIMDESIVLTAREVMGLLKYHYADYRYDISGNTKRRTGLVNLSQICKYRQNMLLRENLITFGYIRQFMSGCNNDIFIPLSLINFIEKYFVHDDRYDVIDNVNEINEFIIDLSMLSGDKYELDQFIAHDKFQLKVKKLLNDRVYQYIWKKRMVNVVKKYFNNPPQTINLLSYLCRRKNRLITFYCDICQDKMLSRAIKFFQCGHSFCDECGQNMMRNDSKCTICNTKLDLTQYCKYSIMLRDFDNI